MSATRRCGYLTAATCAVGLVAASPAWSAASMSVSADLSSGLAVGKQGVAGSVTVTNTSTAPQNNEGSTLSLQSLTLVPSCGQSAVAADCPPAFREPGVVAVNADAIGAAGTACAGVAFSVATIDPAQDKLQFTAASPVLLSRPTGTAPSCRVGFTFNVLKMPAFDADAATAGIQTARVAFATAIHSNANFVAAISPSLSDTILRATATLIGSAEGAVLNTPTTDSVTLSGSATAPAPTGTITFRLHRPEDTTCAGEPLLLSAAPVSGNGTYASEPFTATSTGTHRWIASYSGDANTAPVATPCNAPGQSVTVRTATVLTGGPSRVGRLAATLTGSINGGGAPTTYRFEYGRTTAYGLQTPAQPVGEGGGSVPVAAVVSNLRAGATYHYRLVATNAGGDVVGPDSSFKTQAKAVARRLTLSVSPRRDPSAPYRFAFRGRLVRPTAIGAAQGCSGTVSIRITSGGRLVTSSRATLTKTCTYAKRVTVPRRAGGGRGLRVAATFLGNRVLARKIAGTSIHAG